jgi:large subunit ribosomal protein L2
MLVNMGRPIRAQKLGKGSPTYRMPPYKFMPSIKYRGMEGTVVDIVKDPRRNAPLAKIEYADKNRGYLVAIEGMRVGDAIGRRILQLKEISEGAQISSVETYPNSGPKLCRTSGSFATVVSKGIGGCLVQLPSKKMKTLHPNCRATIGIPAGEGREEKPFVKAGAKFYAAYTKGKIYPRVSGSKMNAVDHPYGGSGSGKIRPPVSRHAPPGAKVGEISPRRTGRKKR